MARPAPPQKRPAAEHDPGAGSTLTAELIVESRRLSDLQVAPDGHAAAFVVAPMGQREARPTSAIWLASLTDGAPPRQLTLGTSEDRAPRWSPDGAWLYFLSDRAERGTAQLQRLPLAGGEAEALTDWKAGVATAVPLPDGRTVAVLAVDAKTEDEERRARAGDDAEVFGHAWPRQRLHLFDVESRHARAVEALRERHVAEVVPSPDGTALAVLTWPTPEPDHRFRDAELALVEVARGEVRPVCALPTGGEGLTWGRERGRVYLRAHAGRDLRGGMGVVAVDLHDGSTTVVTAGQPACPIGLWTGPQADPLVTMAEGLDTALYRLEATGALALVARWTGDAWGVSASGNGRAIALVRSAATAPAEVWAGPSGGPYRRLTDFHAELRRIRWGRQERLRWTAPDGWPIEGLLLLPPGRSRADGPFPLVTLVHGGPYARYADGCQLGWAPSGQWLATAGYAVLLPNPRGSLGYGHAFADQVSGTVGTADWADILAGIEALIAAGVADPARLGIGGWSQGGYMTAWAIGQTSRFRAAVMGAGVSDWGLMVAESDLPHFEAMLGGSTGWEGPGPHRHDALSPISFVGRVTTPVLILHGAADARVPASQGCFFARGLRAHGVPHELVLYPREPHEIRERQHQLDILRRTRAWFDRWLQPPTGDGDEAGTPMPDAERSCLV